MTIRHPLTTLAKYGDLQPDYNTLIDEKMLRFRSKDVPRYFIPTVDLLP
jgi:hypothetical protein